MYSCRFRVKVQITLRFQRSITLINYALLKEQLQEPCHNYKKFIHMILIGIFES